MIVQIIDTPLSNENIISETWLEVRKKDSRNIGFYKPLFAVVDTLKARQEGIPENRRYDPKIGVPKLTYKEVTPLTTMTLVEILTTSINPVDLKTWAEEYGITITGRMSDIDLINQVPKNSTILVSLAYR